MAKVLKGKYFPKSSFMEAKLTTNGSYTWNSIMKARELMQKGARKMVGAGISIEIWKDPWVPNLPGFHVISTSQNSEDSPKVVSDLITEGRWNKPLLDELFSSWEVLNIMKIPIPFFGGADEWTWQFNKDGNFSVKSAYYAGLEEKNIGTVSASSDAFKSVWEKLWKAKVPEKVKNFGWKAIHNGLPVRANLKHKGVTVEEYCPVCGEEEESVLHLLTRCADAELIWYMSPLRLQTRKVQCRNFKEWCCELTLRYRD